jgi:peptidoglycan/xylan/chitin deacetylase (PgdA/CDA1 family)
MNNHNNKNKPSSNTDLESNGKQAIKKDHSSNLKRSAPQTSNEAKPLASLSLDLDNLWSYMKTHGDPGWETFPSYLDTFIPLVLDVLAEMNLKITFFIVGRDAALEKNHYALKMLTDRGHEVGNHSFNHDPWLHLYPKDQIKNEILEAERHIQQVTGQKPIGFRGPGFCWSSEILEVLVENGYLYDASRLPTFIGPMARAYYFWKSDLTKEEKEKRNKLFGSFKEGLKPVKPYHLKISNGNKILEIPVTTIPFFKTPFHLSYLIYLNRYSQILMSVYLHMAIQMCRMTGTMPSFLLHPLDLIGGDILKKLIFFPGMEVKTEQKISLFKKIISCLSDHFQLFNMSKSAKHMIVNGDLKVKLCR